MQNLSIKIKYRDEDTKRIEKIHVGDWIDLATNEMVRLKQGEFKLIDLGVAMELPLGFEAHIIPRSSTFIKFKILQTNSFGLIDNSYSGDDDYWMFPALAMDNTTIERWSRICQFRITQTQPKLTFYEVELLGNKSRGGFGSTGAD